MELGLLGLDILLFSICIILTILCIAGGVCVLKLAFDFMRFEKEIIRGLKIAKEKLSVDKSSESVYMLTNFDTDIEQDLYRIKKIEEIGFRPDVRIYRKNSLPQRHILRDLQRWCNNRFLYHSCDFMDYVPRSDGKTIREIYFR